MGQSHWLHGLRQRSAVARLLGLQVRIAQGHGRLSLVSVVFVRQMSLRRAHHSSRRVLPIVVCLSVIEEPHRGGLIPLRLLSHETDNKQKIFKLWSYKL
jgi:hypothetical protein